MNNLQIISPHADVRKVPSQTAGLEMQILHGEQVKLLEKQQNWSLVESSSCGYVGYVENSNLSENIISPTHIVCLPHTFLYPCADIKSSVVGCLSLGSKVAVRGFAREGLNNFAVLENGTYIIEGHLRKLGGQIDYVAICEMLLGVPYLWGGNSGLAVDCSGLIYLAHLLAGNNVARNADMQQKSESLGSSIEIANFANLQKGDYIFWQGHVGIMANNDTLLHASGYHMKVVKEPIIQAIERIKSLIGSPTAVRRLF